MADRCACGCLQERHRMGRGSCKDCPRFNCEAFTPLGQIIEVAETPALARLREAFPFAPVATEQEIAEHLAAGNDIVKVVRAPETSDSTEEVSSDGGLTDVVPAGVASGTPERFEAADPDDYVMGPDPRDGGVEPADRLPTASELPPSAEPADGVVMEVHELLVSPASATVGWAELTRRLITDSPPLRLAKVLATPDILECFDAWRCAICGSRSWKRQTCYVIPECKFRWMEPVTVEIRRRPDAGE